MTDLASIQQQRSNRLALLLADSLKERPDYSLDGQTVSRAQWREGQMRIIKELNELEQTLDPYELRGFAL